MTAWQLKELEDHADALARLLRAFERFSSYDDYSMAKKLLREVIDPDVYAAMQKLLQQRGIEL